jgi:hypothetical protein
MQHNPPAARVWVAPIHEASAPAIRLPTGCMPRKAMVKKLITRPRFWSSTMV